MQSRDGYVIVAAAWLALSLFGALPYVVSGAIPHYIDALFETVSGLTTTGASILTEIEHLPRSVLFWRAETQWIGGMGVLVMFLALMPRLGGDGAVHLMRAESPGPIKSKLTPKVGQTAKILYTIYLGLTAAETLALRIAGMSWFDAVTHAFTTLATGGFSVRNASIAAYHSAAVVWIVTVFTFLAGVNFALLYAAVLGRWRQVLRSHELRLYTALLLCAVALVAVDLHAQAGQSASQAATDAAFQVVTVMTTTGYSTCDFAQWPAFSRMVLAALMFIGGSAGSTAGGIKVSRLLIHLRSLRRELGRIVHPRHLSVITMDGEVVDESVVSGCHSFLAAYLLVLAAGALIVGLDDLGFQESFTASLTCISNVGPALGKLGPAANFSILSYLSKAALSLEMLMGRLELLPLLVLLNPATWRDR
jgi:trk system potassium uptake protein TrkH